MRRFGLLFIICLWAQSLVAQVVPVQTGEHASFTRVVLTIPANSEWRVGRVDGGYGVEVQGVDGFNTDGFFDIIPFDRIKGVSQIDEQVLKLEISCDCSVSPFLDRPGILVIDVSDGLTSSDADTEVALFDDMTQTLSPRVFEPSAPPEVTFDLIKAPPAGMALPRQSPLPSLQTLTEQAAQERQLTALEGEITQSLSRAANQGLLVLREDIDVSFAAEESFGSERQTETVLEFAPRFVDEVIRPGVDARTSVDIGLSEAIGGQISNTGSGSCWPDDWVDVASWGSDDPFSIQMGQAWTGLIGERDRMDSEKILALSRLYIYFGFGVEAKNIFLLDGKSSQERLAVQSVGAIIDDEELAHSSILLQAHCPGMVSLWSILAGVEGEELDEYELESIAGNFRQLPHALRNHLRPRLVSALIELNQLSFAELMMGVQFADDASIEDRIAQSEILIGSGRSDVAEISLESIIEDEINVTPQSIFALIYLKIENGESVSGEIIETAQALKFEYRNYPISLEISEALIMAHLNNAQYHLAQSELSDTAEMFPKQKYEEIQDDIIRYLTKDGSDVEFLNAIFSTELEIFRPSVENLVGQRLIDLGFPGKAMRILQGLAVGGDMSERRYLRAEAAMQLNDESMAQTQLAGIESQRAKMILRSAVAGTSLNLLPDTSDDGTITLAWRDGDWATLFDSDDALLSEVSELMLGGVSRREGSEAPLNEGRSLISDASFSRMTIDALLNRFQVPLAANP